MTYQLYIHTPYCKSKCNYCAFYSLCLKPDWKSYEKAIIRDLKENKELTGKVILDSIYFGGGTPNLIPIKTFESILEEIRKDFIITEKTEISLESNPNIKTDFQGLKSLGFNRISVGIQSLNDENLKLLGRCHNTKQSIDFINNAKKHFKNISGDFIYALPNQTLNDFSKELKEIKSLELNHLSMYELTIEKNTPMAKYKKVNSDLGADFYNLIQEKITDEYPRYEVSNYAKEKYECKHNKNIWLGDAYIGVGSGAFGRLFLKNTWYETYVKPDINLWLKQPNTITTKLDNKTRAIEKIILGLRTRFGINLTDEIKEVLNYEYIKNNPNYFIEEGENLKLTEQGFLIQDSILEFLL